MTQIDTNSLESLSDKELLNLAEALNVLDDKQKYNKLEFLFPDTGPRRRDLYKKHMLFLKAGAVYRERALIAANRTGKTYLATAEDAYHMTGRYPKWWQGKRFEHPVDLWAVGKTHETTRDILQKYMVGNRYDMGTGMLPRDDLFWDGKFHCTTKSGVPDAILDVYCKHHTNNKFDGYSHCTFKSYVQGKDAFMGDSIHVVHLDEEPSDKEIYGECLTRTMTTNGIILCTFTPLDGMSEVVLSFLPGGKFPMGGIGVVEDDTLGS